ncbi:MAG TPA: exodeoxyribonuclease VII large subunit [Verrucomicrobium sp.]|nr:exodeoxyribonuclease VII large subunit [Verrucomicrobium sp.]
MTVSQLTRQIRSLLEDQIGDVSVEGELSNHRLQSSGHQYFTLKDEGAQISCVLFRGASTRMQTPLRDGMQVLISGELTVYEQRGNYQIIVRAVQPKGQGSLQARFEALKQKLNTEGLFDNQWKKPVPKLPRVVALVTSPTGAAIRDMINILTRRAPWLRVLVFPVRVQGQGAEREIAQAIETLNQDVIGLPRPDTIVVGRGGGSLEDLWNFNEEVVARAIFASTIPVISAVGHEIDFTIADFVADLRAPTPSAAAELLAPDVAELKRHFEAMEKSMTHRVLTTLEHHERVLELTGKGALKREPERQLREAAQSVDDLEDTYHRAQEDSWRNLDERLARQQRTLEKFHPERVLTEATHRMALIQQQLKGILRQRLDQHGQKIMAMRKLLKSMGPDSVLSRGFSMTTDATGKIIDDASKLRVGDMMITRLGKGKVASVVTPNK